MASPLTTHILDTANGVPAVGVPITLTRLNGEGVATILASGVTNRDGRVADLVRLDGVHEFVLNLPEVLGVVELNPEEHLAATA